MEHENAMKEPKNNQDLKKNLNLNPAHNILKRLDWDKCSIKTNIIISLLFD